MKKILPVIVITILTIFVGMLFSSLGPVRALDEAITDANIRYFAPPTKVSDDIVIVFLDEATMKELPYRSPVPRDFLYKLNEKILAAGPRVVAYDIFFKDPTIEKHDRQLALSFKKGPVLAVSAGKTDKAGKDFEDLPMNLFLNSLKGVGLSDLPFSSSDTTVRHAQFEFQIAPPPSPSPIEGEGKHVRPGFVAAIYNAATDGHAEARLHDPKNRLKLLGFHFPPFFSSDSATQTRIRFAGHPSKIGSEESLFKIFPANLVANGLIPSDWLKDKIVLVGAAYEDGTDAYITPYYSSRYHYTRMPGVEIHANILNQILTKQFYYYPPKYFIPLKLLGLGIMVAFLFLYGPIWRGAAGVGVLTIIFSVSIIFYFHKFGLIIPLIPFEGSMLAAYAASLGWRSITEGKQKRFIKNVFAKYVPPSVVDKMIANPELLTLGGELREVTCMFTDIASFTTISEKLDPKTLVEFLNQYLDRLTRIIFKHGGTLDKYEGDAIIAFFGAPVELPNHREAALLAAIEMQKANDEISTSWRERCGREIVTRIGLNSGQVIVGNMGSDLRFDYTAIGDSMNLASRLEGANKFFNTRVLASEATVGPIINSASDICARPAAQVMVKGKTKPVRVFEVVGLKSELPKDLVEKINGASWPKDIIELTSK